MTSSNGKALRILVGARSDPLRLLRGAELVERGAVSSLQLFPGRLVAAVSGSRREAYTVNITTPVTGSLPHAGSPVRWSCSCPDWGDPCKHAVAVMLFAAQRIDDEPELMADLVGSVEASELELDDAFLADPSQSAPSSGRRPSAAANRRLLPLPTIAPLWVDSIEDKVALASAEQFFGETPLGNAGLSHSAAFAPSSDPSFGADRLRDLGPLMVDDYDLAPDIIRMYTWLRAH